MTQNSKRIAVILSVLILVIGFAAVTTTLVLNGGLLVGEADDFKIIFTEAILDGRKDNSLISSDKKTITFESKELLDLNDKTTLEYMVANTSRNYDANISVNCSISSGASEYVYVRNNPSEMIVEAGTSKKGTIEVELIKVLTESKEVSLTCEIISTPIEREHLAIPYNYNVMTNSELITEFDSHSDTDITHRVGCFWDYKFDITKIVFENKMQAHETLDELIFDVSANQDKSVMSYLVKNEGASSKYTLYIQADGKIYAPKDCSYLFFSFFSLESIDGLEYFDTSNVTNMSNMFGWCEKLQVIDVSNFDTSEVVNMSGMFSVYGAYSTYPLLSDIVGLESFDTRNVTDMSLMFLGCRKITSLDLNNFDTSSVTNMSYMFNGCSSLISLDVSNFDTSSVTNMSYMFYGCSNLINLDISSFDTSNVSYMNYMFSHCSSLTSLDISNFDTSNVSDMRSMFDGCSNLTSLDLSNFDTSNVIDDVNMFSAMPDNAKVYVKDIAFQEWILNLEVGYRPSAWSTANVMIKE